MIQFFLIFSDWAFFALRIFLGITVLIHGLPKLHNLKKTSESFKKMGFRPGGLWGPLVAIVESSGGALLVIGLFVQPTALILTIQFIVIVLWRIRKGDKFVGGYELDFALLIGFFVLTTTGSLLFSIDGYFRIILDNVLYRLF